MTSLTPDDSSDPFSLAGKNPRRVAPAVRRNIAMRKFRIRFDFALCVAALLAVVLHVVCSWVPLWVALICMISIPLLLLGVFGEWRVLRRQKAKLAECERLNALDEANRHA